MTSPISNDVRIRILAERGAGASQVLRGTRQELAALRGESVSSSVAVQRMNREFAATRMELAGAQARVNAASVAMSQLGTTTVKARQGIGTIRSTLFSLAATMTGVRGTVGSLVGGLAQFAVGNAVAIGIMGGIMAIAGAFRWLTRDAREARKQAKELADELDKAIAGRVPKREILAEKRAALLAQFAATEEELGPQEGRTARFIMNQPRLNQLLQERLDIVKRLHEINLQMAEDIATTRSDEIGYLTEAQKLQTLTLQDRKRGLELEKELTAQLAAGNLSLRERNELTKELRDLQGISGVSIVPSIVDITRPSGLPSLGISGLGAFREAYQRRKRMMALGAGAEYEGMPEAAAGAVALGGGFKQLAENLRLTEQFLRPVVSLHDVYIQRLGALNALRDAGEISAEEYTDALERLRAAFGEGKKASERWAQSIILGVGQLAQSIIGGDRGAGGIIGGILGIGGAALSLGKFTGAGTLGLGLTALGGIISAVSRRSDPVPVQIKGIDDSAVSKLRTGPTEIILQIVDPVTGNIRQVYRAMHDLSRIDANPRIPFGFGGFYG